jgi:hypothetical protein
MLLCQLVTDTNHATGYVRLSLGWEYGEFSIWRKFSYSVTLNLHVWLSKLVEHLVLLVKVSKTLTVWNLFCAIVCSEVMIHTDAFVTRVKVAYKPL